MDWHHRRRPIPTFASPVHARAKRRTHRPQIPPKYSRLVYSVSYVSSLPRFQSNECTEAEKCTKRPNRSVSGADKCHGFGTAVIIWGIKRQSFGNFSLRTNDKEGLCQLTCARYCQWRSVKDVEG